MANKIDKSLYGPSLLEVVLSAVLGLLAGVLVAGVYLVFKPVRVVKEMPKEPVRFAVYYVPGVPGVAKSTDWQAKVKQFIAGGVCVEWTEAELNGWASSLALPAAAADAAAPAKPAAPAAKPAAKPGDKPAEKPAASAPDGFVIPAKPNFRLTSGKLQMGTICTLNWYGLATDVPVQATGYFQVAGDAVEFVPESVYLGSCPLHFFPPLANALIRHILDAERVSEEIRATWVKLTDAKIDGGTLKLTVQ
jgi:hypothetical protein